MLKLPISLITAAVVAGSESFAQGTAPRLSASLLACGTDTLEVHLARPDGRRRTGLIVDECRVKGAGESRVIERVYRTTDAVLGNRVDTIVDRWDSLSPISYRSRSTREATVLKWVAGRVSGEVTPSGQPTTSVDESTPAGTYNSASFDLVMRASPLSTGYALSVLAYLPGTGVKTLTAKVVGEEVIAGTASWRIDADFTGMPVSFWVAKDGRRLVKQIMQVAPNTTIEFIKPSGTSGR